MQEGCINCQVKLTFVCGVMETERILKLDGCPCKDCLVKAMCDRMCDLRYEYWNKLMKIENERKYNEL